MKALTTFGYALVWLLIWTPFAFVLGLITFLFILEAFYGGSEESLELTAREVKSTIIAATLILALILFGIVILLKKARAKSKKPNYFFGVGHRILAVCTVIGLIGTIGFTLSIPNEPSAETQAADKPQLKQNPQLLAVAKQVGAKHTNDMGMRYVENYPDPKRLGEYQQYLYDDDSHSHGKMTVRKGISGNELKSTVAHEYLHHVWFSRLDQETKDRLTSDLITMYGKDPFMQQRADGHYSQRGMLAPTELFSFYCTESSDYYLTQFTLRQCNKYINRGELTMVR